MHNDHHRSGLGQSVEGKILFYLNIYSYIHDILSQVVLVSHAIKQLHQSFVSILHFPSKIKITKQGSPGSPHLVCHCWPSVQPRTLDVFVVWVEDWSVLYRTRPLPSGIFL